ncbi:MAG TPA: hypothetical protein RMH99_07885 [Sandaracinaceae bacterium LLY-WYZ-13_1]|nr:hypothetical protein [Sandaracinaceae bacterium LLY-WYZ-13_1]
MARVPSCLRARIAEGRVREAPEVEPTEELPFGEAVRVELPGREAPDDTVVVSYEGAWCVVDTGR